ncbi:MAG: hypothetical protein FJ265_20435 [Planctomycetes bacterium]|nr:hypothetical protein [Planctomycetota bacterium]
MSGTASDAARRPAGFREAIAQWRLAVHTEVKRASTLPTAMFDACDPMLETWLAETAGAVLGRMPEPPAWLAEDEDGEQRLETVHADDLRALPRRLGAAAAAADLGEGLGAEYLAVLADVCCRAEGAPRRVAVRRLAEDFGVADGTDLDALAQRLQQEAGAAIEPGADPGRDAELAAACQRVAAAVVQQLAERPGGAP